jgi:crossover junction endodeoxyribonuclease RuvC
MGLGIVEARTNSYDLVHYGILKLSSKEDIPSRLGSIYRCVKKHIIDFDIDVVAIEDVFVSDNARSALKLGQGRGVAIAAAIETGTEVFEYTPRQIKKAVSNYGAADKNQIRNMVEMLLGVRGIEPLDAADALAVSICHINTIPFRNRAGVL